jgi:hypothetical protein
VDESRELTIDPQLDPVVRSVHEVLARPKVSLGGLHGFVAEKHLDLFKLATCGSTQFRAGPSLMPHAA